MNNKIVVTRFQDKILIVFLKDDKCIKIRAIENVSENSQTVYLGRVDSVKQNIDSCFIRYNGKTGFLKGSSYKAETVLPVVLKKETDSNKQDEVTDKISLAGIYTVVSEYYDEVCCSGRVTNKKLLIEKYSELGKVILRQNAESADKESVINEYNYLVNELKHLNEIKDKRTNDSILYEGLPSLIEFVFSENVSEYDEIVTDDDDAFTLINDFYDKYKSKGICINLPLRKYTDESLALSTLISLSKKIDIATNRKVFLKSDAYITIDKTEALTVIDVNSGTTVTKGDKASVIHSINLEAAKEIALQLKLRNITGIIIVDFINEYKGEFKEELVNTLKSELKYDDSQAKCHGITKLGLVEITRKRKYKSLKEQLWK